MTNTIRQPIVTVAGHVDHGKTSILDAIRGTKIQSGEAGGITQKISFTTLPQENIKLRASSVLDTFKIPLEIPGLLFIDTPGHAAFTNMRHHGGSLADIAILVIDINDGIKPQTTEVLQILKASKTPFIIALNKVDNISGWQTHESKLITKSILSQRTNVKTHFDEKFYTIIGALYSHGIQAELYSEISDFTKSIAIIPCSAHTTEGISEILAILTALAQKFLHDKIKRNKQPKATILEVKRNKQGNFIETILHDGQLKNTDELAIASMDGLVVKSKIRTMQEVLPLSKGYKTVSQANSATGLILQLTTKQEIMPGLPIQTITETNTIEKISKEFSQEISNEIKTQNTGIIAKADSLGSLQALLTLLHQANINVLKAGIGPITKKDVYSCSAIQEKEDKIIIGFNVKPLEEIEDLQETQNIKILTNDVVYKLIEDLEGYKTGIRQEIEKQKLSELPTICKLRVLDFCFRNTSPAIFGVEVMAGTLKAHERFINSSDKKVGQVKEIQHEKKSARTIESGTEVAISMPGVNFERQLTIGEFLYTNLAESQFRKFKEHRHLLSSEEKSILQEIATIKRHTNMTWGI
jgi:translation initiation factor 5B